MDWIRNQNSIFCKLEKSFALKFKCIIESLKIKITCRLTEKNFYPSYL